MQQVVHKAKKKRNKLLNNINQFWVLHKRLLLRGIIAIFLAFTLLFVFQMRGAIVKGSAVLISFFSGEFAKAGFGIEKISITGQVLTKESDVVKALELVEKTSTITFDLDLARKQILELPSVSSLTIRKIYPNQLVIKIQEKQPIARWRVGDETYLVDDRGEKIATSIDGADGELMLVIGVNANENVKKIVEILEGYPDLKEDLVALSLIADRRWDMIYSSGLRVSLPETGILEALDNLKKYQKEYSLLNRDISLIDLRIKNELLVRINKRDTDIDD